MAETTNRLGETLDKEHKIGFGSYFEPFALPGVQYKSEDGKQYPVSTVVFKGLEYKGIPPLTLDVSAYPVNAVRANAVTPHDLSLARNYPPTDNDFDLTLVLDELKRRKIKPGDRLGMKKMPLCLTVTTSSSGNDHIFVPSQDPWKQIHPDIAEELSYLRLWAVVNGLPFIAEPERELFQDGIIWFNRFYHPEFGDYGYDQEIKQKVAPQLDNRLSIMLPTSSTLLKPIRIMLGDIREPNDPYPFSLVQSSPVAMPMNELPPPPSAAVPTPSSFSGRGGITFPYGPRGASPNWLRRRGLRDPHIIVPSIIQEMEEEKKKQEEEKKGDE